MAEPGGCLEAASSRLLAHLLPGQHAHTGLWVRVVCGVCGPCVVCEQKARVLPVAPGISEYLFSKRQAKCLLRG